MSKMKVRHYNGGIYTVIGTTKPMPKEMESLTVFVAGHTEEHLRDVYVYIERLERRDIHEPTPSTNIYETQIYVKDETVNYVIYFNEEFEIFARPEEMFWEWGYFNDADTYEPRFAIIEGHGFGE